MLKGMFVSGIGGSWYLDYAREIDLMSGLNRQNSELIKLICQIIETRAPGVVKGISIEEFENIASRESAIGIPRKVLEEIGRKKLSAEQIDDYMDRAELQFTKLARSEDEARLSAEVASGENEANRGLEATVDDAKSRLTPMVEFAASVQLLGNVTRNSEFTDAEEKVAAAKLYILSMIRTFIILTNILSDVIFMEKEGLPDAEIRDMKVWKNILTRMFLGVISSSVSFDIGTSKLISVYEGIIDNTCATLGEKVLLTMLFLDISYERWDRKWVKFISENSNNRFLLEVLVQKIWYLIHTRVYSDEDRKKFRVIIEKIERALGNHDKTRNSLVIQNLEKKMDEINRDA